MGRFTTRTRRGATGGPEARGELSPKLRAALPPRFEAVAEDLASGSGSVAACEAVGDLLARDGLGLAECLDALATTSRLVRGSDPGFAEIRAFTVAWSDATLGYLTTRSCADPLTGLSSLAHLRSRVSDLYRGEARGEVRGSHALVVVATPPRPDPQPGSDEVLTRALRIAEVGQTTRTVFAGGETISHVAPGRLVVLADRDERMGRRVELLRTMLDGAALAPARIWIEGLPDSDDAAACVLDELIRV